MPPRKTRSKAKGARAKAAKGATRPRPPSKRTATVPPPRTTIVGVGASAGGLEAFSALLAALPPHPGLALVLVQHLAPQHESALPTLLGHTTELPVVQAADGMRVEADHVYVIPPNFQMGITDDVLHLSPRPTDSSQYVPVDLFLRSLAESARERAIAVILSGTASDGAVGIREVKAVGGITLAQDPATAKYDGMPRAAIATGMVDRVLPPDELAAELVAIARHPYLRRPPAPFPGTDEAPAMPSLLRDQQLQRIFTLLRQASGVDFRHYKLPTIERRLQRRMVLRKITGVDEYVDYLQQHPDEAEALHEDLLIHVTRFFREPSSFEALCDHILPQIIEHQHGDNPIRVWIAGCSTGEEAYSVAIALLECLGDRANVVPVQVFATDVSEHAIEQARSGIYPDSIAADVSPTRLRRFFTKVERGYRIAKMVRDACIFARQDLTRDPPFSKLDLVVCRNVLIYMTAVLQTRLLTIFHYALKPKGFLMLGQAETVGSLSELFTVADKRHRLYEKKLNDGMLPAMSFRAERPLSVSPPARRADGPAQQSMQQADRIALERFAPPGVIIDEDFQILQFRGQTGLFLEPPSGDPSVSLLKMAREGLLHGLRSAFQAARKSGIAVRKDGLKLKVDGGWRDTGIEIIPLSGERKHYLVAFHAGSPPAAEPASRPRASAERRGAPRGAPEKGRVQRLETELAASREYLQSIIQEVEAANEELQSANEEILSSNEELQSTNEELDTAKEELQSTNEELNTLNEELHGRNAELSRANSDLVNFLGSIQIAIVIVGSDLRIRRFTPMAERFLNLIATDVGRPIGHIKPNIDTPDLEHLIAQAIDTVTPQEREVQDREGNWFALRIRPYKNLENRIDGAVLALFDIQAAKTRDGERQRRRDGEAVFDAVPVLVVLDDAFRIRQGNQAFCRTFGPQLDAIRDRTLFEIGAEEWNVPGLRDHVTHLLNGGTGDEDRALDVVSRSPRHGERRFAIHARRLDGLADGAASLLLAIVERAPSS